MSKGSVTVEFCSAQAVNLRYLLVTNQLQVWFILMQKNSCNIVLTWKTYAILLLKRGITLHIHVYVIGCDH
jgi:hypothetical protein